MIARHERPTPGPAMEIAAMFSAMVPQLRTERCILRAVKLSDFEAICEISCTERGKYIGGPISREDAWFEMTNMCANWMLHGHGGWTVEHIKTGEVLGFVILGLEPSDQDVELGYSFREKAEGKGFAFEATTVARDWAFSELKLPSVASYIDRDNTRSIKLAQRLGAIEDTPADWSEDVLVYRHINPETRT